MSSTTETAPRSRMWTVERTWQRSGFGAVAGRTDAALVAALLVVARTYTDATRVAVGLRQADEVRLLELDLPGDLPLTELVADVDEQLTSAPVTTAGTSWHVCLGAVAEAAPDADVTVSVTTDPSAVRVVVTMPTSAAAERMLGHLGQALDRILTGSSSTVRDVDVRTDTERELLAAVNATQSPVPPATVVDLFLERVRVDGAARAVVHDRSSLTYAELEQASGELAARLTALGAGPGRTVAILLGKGLNLVVSMLAVLRAGAAYVPIDVASPSPRRDHVLRDAEAAVLISDHAVDVPDGVQLVDLTASAGGAGEPVAAGADSPAYVMYTSGSTGTPKGVVVSHRAVTARIVGADYVTLDETTVLLQVGSVAFDATTFEIWGPLVHGGTVVFADDGIPTPDSLRAAVVRHGVNTMFLTTALFNQLVDVDPACLRGCTVLVGGEANSPRHLARAVEACPDTTFVHVYGPTENTTFSTSYRIRRAPTASVPIGRPITRSTAVVMSREGTPQPIGAAGELWVGGAGVADGYLGLPELTAAKFVEWPDGSGARYYRTGDVARWSDDMQVEFIGRADTQLKVRGFRVEPGEIEAHLLRCPGVLDAAVVLPRASEGVLWAFFTSATAIDPAELKARLAEHLPEYMVPGRYERLPALPLTANNKVDRGELERWRSSGDHDTPAPAGLSLVDQVAQVFAEVLDVPSVEPTDNFFDLGGHSLMAIKVWSRLRAEFGVDFELREVIDTANVAELAAVLVRPTTVTRQRPRLGAPTESPSDLNREQQK